MASPIELDQQVRDTERTIVTYDDDFIEDVPPTEYHAALFFEDVAFSAQEVATVVDSVSQLHPFEDVVGLQKTGRQ